MCCASVTLLDRGWNCFQETESGHLVSWVWMEEIAQMFQMKRHKNRNSLFGVFPTKKMLQIVPSFYYYLIALMYYPINQGFKFAVRSEFFVLAMSGILNYFVSFRFKFWSFQSIVN